MEQIKLGNIVVDVVQKDIKNVHLSVYPPEGTVRIAAPLHMNPDTIRVYAISKLSWIKKQQKKLSGQQRESPREYITRESHYYLGKRYLLKVIEEEAIPKVTLHHNSIYLYVRPGADKTKRKEVLENFYRENLKVIFGKQIQKWEKVMKVSPKEFSIRKMKTKWGTCNIEASRIWLNLELVKKPEHCIEYIVVHEMVHLIERHHNEKFIAWMNLFLPHWREIKTELNTLPVCHVDWGY